MEEKTKSGKLKKIIIAIIAVVVIAAVVIGVLVATGKLEFNFTKKSKMVAGVEKLGESVTEPIDKIMDTADKNGTTIKLLDKISKDSEIEASTEITANIEEISSPELSSSQKSTLKSAIDIINDSKLGLNFKYDGNESVYLKVDGNVGGESVTGEALYDGKQAGIRSEEINKKWLTISKDDIMDLLKESGLDLENNQEAIEKTTEQIEKLAKTLEIDEKTQKKIEERYKDVLKDYINEKSKDIEQEKTKVKVDGKEKSCNKLTLELDDDDFKDLAKSYIKTFGKDEDVKKILTNFVDAYSEIMEEAGEKETAKEMSEAIDQIYDNIDELVDEIDEIEFDGKIELVVYATTNKVYRTDINIDVDDTKLTLETTFNKETTVTDISMESHGASVDIGTLTLTSTDDTVGLRFEAASSLMKLAGLKGDNYYFDIKYKTEKNKMTSSIEVNAGEYGEGTIEIVTDIDKNTDSEYSDTTTFNIDIDVPDYITTKMTLTQKSNIKLGGVSIPSISSKDAVDMTDESALQEYEKESEENAKSLLKKFSKIESLEPLFEDIIDELD